MGEHIVVRFVDKPYTTDGVSHKLSSIKWKLACGIGMVKVYFITLADNRSDLFDIYPASVFKQKRFRKSGRVVIGVADSYKGACGLIENMVTDCMNDRPDLSDIRGYFELFIKDHL